MTKFTSSFSAMATIIFFQSGIQARNLAENICGKPGDSCMNKENYEYCTMLLRRGCRRRDILALDSCPVQFMCTEKLLDELIDDACTTQNVQSDDGYDKCYDLCKDKDRVCNDSSDDSRYDSRDAPSFRQSDRESFRETNREFYSLSTSQRYGSSDSSRDRSSDRSRSYDSRDSELTIYQRNGSSYRSREASRDDSRDRSSDASRDRSRDRSSDASRDRSRNRSSDVSRDDSRDRSRDSSSNQEDCNAYRSCSVLGLDDDITQERSWRSESNDLRTNSFSGSQRSNFRDDYDERESDSPGAPIFFGRMVSSILAVYYLFR